MCHLIFGPIFLIFMILHCFSYIPLSGFHGVISGFLVGIKQIIPDLELPFLKIKVKVWCSNFFSINFNSLLFSDNGFVVILLIWHWHHFHFCSVVTIYRFIVFYCYELLDTRGNIISSNCNIWYIYELDLPQILAEKPRNETQRWPKWGFCIFYIFSRCF